MSYHKEIFYADRMSLENMDHAEQKRHNNATALYMRGFISGDSPHILPDAQRDFEACRNYEDVNKVFNKYRLKYKGNGLFLQLWQEAKKKNPTPRIKRMFK